MGPILIGVRYGIEANTYCPVLLSSLDFLAGLRYQIYRTQLSWAPLSHTIQCGVMMMVNNKDGDDGIPFFVFLS